MKKFLPLVLVVVVAVIVASVVFIQKRWGMVTLEIPSILPSETILFLHLPNVPRTREAWQKTSLRKMARESDVAAYLDLVEAAIPHFETTKAKLEEVAKIDPIQAFIAVTDDAPTVIGGVEFSGDRGDVEVLLNELKTKMQEVAPTGRFDIAMHAGHEVQMFHFRGKTLAASFHQRWYLIANSVDLLEQTLDSLGAYSALSFETLEKNPYFKKCVSRMPQNPEAFLFVQTESLIARFLSLLSVSGQTLSATKVKELREVRALAAATKFDGQNIRDTTFVLKPGEKAGEPLEKAALAFTSAQTQFFYASRFDIPDEIEFPDTSLDLTGVLQVFKGTIAAFEAHGITLNDIKNAFGTEIGTMLSWPEDRNQPSLLMILDVRNFEEAEKLLDTVAEAGVAGAALSRCEIEGGVYYSLVHNGSSWFPPPSIALSRNYAVIGLSLEDIRAGLEQAVLGKRALLGSASFDRASTSVITPTLTFAYVDAPALFDRIYKLAHSILTTWSVLVAPSNPLMDPSKLPSVDSITKYLSPMVYSQAEVADGILTESVGPMTVNQSLIAAAVGGGVALYPIVKQQLESGALMTAGGSFRGLSHTVPTSSIPSQTPESKPDNP